MGKKQVYFFLLIIQFQYKLTELPKVHKKKNKYNAFYCFCFISISTKFSSVQMTKWGKHKRRFTGKEQCKTIAQVWWVVANSLMQTVPRMDCVDTRKAIFTVDDTEVDWSYSWRTGSSTFCLIFHISTWTKQEQISQLHPCLDSQKLALPGQQSHQPVIQGCANSEKKVCFS